MSTLHIFLLIVYTAILQGHECLEINSRTMPVLAGKVNTTERLKTNNKGMFIEEGVLYVVKRLKDQSGTSTVAINPTIVGGAQATFNQFPWIVAIIQDGIFMCGGTVITVQYVLTAAHCTYEFTSFDLYLGSIDYTDSVRRVAFVSTMKYVHGNYDATNLNNDIALIKLPTNISSADINSGKITPIRLPSVSQANSENFVDKFTTVCGWGKVNDTSGVSPILNYASLKVISNTQCARFYGNSIVTASVICAYGNGTSNICSGDSGGPLMFKESDGKWTQIGVVSFSAASTCYPYPSGFTRVSSFLTFIQSVSGVTIRM